jgi:GT2 family glycosyltransferase
VSDARSMSAIVVNYQGGALLLECLLSLEEQPGLLEVIVVDNASTDGSVERAASEFPDVRFVRLAENTGKGVAANAGAAVARGTYLLSIDADTRLSRGFVAQVLDVFRDPAVGVCGARVLTEQTERVEFGATIDPLGYPISLPSPRRLPLYAPGHLLVTRADVFDAVGGFDERFHMMMEEVDYCWRVLLRGWDVRIAPTATALHAGGASTPGGYVTSTGWQSTRWRVFHRERNTLAMLLKCYGAPSAAIAVPAYLTQQVATMAILACGGRWGAAKAIVDGVVWNVRELPETLARRRHVQATRRVSDRSIRSRMFRGLVKPKLLLEHGLPQMLPEASSGAEADPPVESRA